MGIVLSFVVLVAAWFAFASIGLVGVITMLVGGPLASRLGVWLEPVGRFSVRS